MKSGNKGTSGPAYWHPRHGPEPARKPSKEMGQERIDRGDPFGKFLKSTSLGP